MTPEKQHRDDRHRLAWVLLPVVLVALPAHGQSVFGRLYVRVYDQTDAVLPGASITLSGPGIGVLSGPTGILGDFSFIRLPPGYYDLTCELDGFESYQQQHIRVSAGVTTSVRALMNLARIEESVTVVAPAPDVPTSPTALTHAFERVDLERKPVVRDPGGVAALVSGIIIDRADLGAFIAGRQLLIGGFGDQTGKNTSWNVEGLTITDMREVGSSPIQYDFDSIEEIDITTGGVDPSVATGGITLNLIARSGDDTWNGSTRFLGSAGGWQDDNIQRLATPANPNGETTLAGFVWNPSFRRPSLAHSYELGAECGGPIRRGRAWCWGAAGLQDTDASAVSGDPDDTQIRNLSLKLNAAAGRLSQTSYTYLSSRRQSLGPGYRSSRPIDASLRTRNPSGMHKLEVVAEPSARLTMTFRGGYAKESESRLPLYGLDVPSYRDATGEWGGSYRSSQVSRPQWEIEVDALQHAQILGRPHAMRFGFSYRRAQAETSTRWPADGVISDLYRGLARITRPADSSVRTAYLGAWSADTFSIGRATVSLGLRYDRQTGLLLPASTAGSPAYPDLLPAVAVPQRDLPFRWNDLSPRIGLSVDLTGKGRTFLRASYARYADPLSNALIAGLGPIAFAGELDFAWTDRDGDGLADPDEIDLASGPTEFFNVDRLAPGSARGRRKADSSLSAPRRTELIAGIEGELEFGLVVGANAIWKRLDNDTWVVGTDYDNPARRYTIDDYVIAGYLTGTLPDGSSYSVPYYALRAERASLAGAGVDSLLTNRHGYWERFAGIEIFASKTLTVRWSAQGSLSWQRTRRFYRGTEGVSDPTNVFSGEDVITLSDVGGRAELWIGTPRWHLVVGGLCQLPRGFDVSANLSARAGYPLVYFVREPAVDPGEPRKDVRVEGARRRHLPAVWQLDAGVSKSFLLGPRASVVLRLDVFNVLNRNTPLQVEGRLNANVTNEVKDLMQSRTARAGVRISF